MRKNSRSVTIKLSFLFLVGLLFGNNVLAQNTFPESGKVGIGTSSPLSNVHVKSSTWTGLTMEAQSNDPFLQFTSDGNSINSDWTLRMDVSDKDKLQLRYDNSAKFTLMRDGRVGIGNAMTSPISAFHVRGSTWTGLTMEAQSNDPFLQFTSDGSSINNDWTLRMDVSDKDVLQFRYDNKVQLQLTPDGTTTTKVLEITGGSDIAEPFDVNPTEGAKPGMVLCIDSNNPGQLLLSTEAYDHTVAGIVSGANGINPGLTLTQEGSVADGSLPVALSGRVYCWVDASTNPVRPGDLLTTSDVPGHAMKASDHVQAHGAVIGKAMSSLVSGRGLVLVLVTLH